MPKIVCPHCNRVLNDEKVPESMKKLYKIDYWDKRIGIYNVDKKRNEGWICPYCFKKL